MEQITGSGTSTLRETLLLMDIEYDYRTGDISLSRDQFSEDYRVKKVHELIESGQISMDDLRDFVHQRLIFLGEFEAKKRIKDIAIPYKKTDILVSYAVSWGKAPWHLHTSDADIGTALRLLSRIVHDLTTPFVPKEIARDFCC